MIGKKIVNLKAVTLAEVVEILQGGEELGFEQAKTLEYVRKFAKLPKEKAEEMITKLMEIKRMTREMAVKIADLLPRTEVEVMSLFAKEIYSLTDEEISKIMEIVGEYAK